ncbi:MAG: aldo/keto reductase [Deltaproteobacteria bacterium]
MIERIPFGRTGHLSSRIIFGAAAIGGMKQEKADATMQLLLEHGINHIDVAADYGVAEERLAPFLAEHRSEFFLATKTGARAGPAARANLKRSLDRMGVDSVDLIQLHNLVDESEWEVAMAPGGALEALVQAREDGLCRFIGVTGHGTRVAAQHLRSLERFAFDSVLLPLNPAMLAQPEYAAEFAKLTELCADRGVAFQTIKSIARRRWQGQEARMFSWYEPLRDAAAISTMVRWVLSHSGTFLNSSSDATLLPIILEAARDRPAPPAPGEVDALVAAEAIEPLFVPGEQEGI